MVRLRHTALHGRVNSRDFRLALTLDTTAGLLRIAVTDARGERLPSPPADCETPPGAESGRSLLLVTALADRWGIEPYPPGGKTVWAECTCETSGPDTPGQRQAAKHSRPPRPMSPDPTPR
ncbi:ATP-binding protein [Streptomyces sp. NPDC058424]|uniref:ATP-binding protein n=1 Tax=Streptomyces sp. NPDC058424 TaxID=3346491 RepID=UPI003656BFA9